jgi:hypothetical protein
MTLLEAVSLRSSVRSYSDQQVEADKLAELRRLIDGCNTDTGLAISLLEDGSEAFRGFFRSYGMFVGVRSLIVLKGDGGDEHLAEKLGYYGERLVLSAVALGLSTCWVAGTYDRKNSVFEIGPGERLLAVVTLGYPGEQKPVMAKMAAFAKKKKKLEKLYISDMELSDWFLAGMEAVSAAPSAMNRQPIMFFNMNGYVFASTKSSSEICRIDLGIAKAHFAIAAGGSFEFGNGGLFTKE